jgi:hypothetical protein
VLQVLLAMVFLAIIGGSGGWLAAQRQKQHHAAASAHASSPAPDPTTADSPTPASASGTPSAVASRSATGRECPEHTEAVAGITPLLELLYLRTAGSEVWICQDRGGALYYQGHLGPSGEVLAEGTNALFLDTVAKDPDVAGGYVATNIDPKGTTRYFVSTSQLVKEIRGTRGKPEPAVTSRAG